MSSITMAFEISSRERHLRRGTVSLMGGCLSGVGLTFGILNAIPFVGWVALAVEASLATVAFLGYSGYSFFKAYKADNRDPPSDSRYDRIYEAAGGESLKATK